MINELNELRINFINIQHLRGDKKATEVEDGG